MIVTLFSPNIRSHVINQPHANKRSRFVKVVTENSPSFCQYTGIYCTKRARNRMTAEEVSLNNGILNNCEHRRVPEFLDMDSYYIMKVVCDGIKQITRTKAAKVMAVPVFM